MSEALYSADFQINPKLDPSALGQLHSMASSMAGKMAGAFDMVSTSIMGLGAAAAGSALAALGAGFAAVQEGVVGVNAALEKTGISIAAVLNANGAVRGMQEGLKVASDQIAMMRKDAVELPGEFQDLVGIFQSVAIPGLRSGATVDELRKLSSNLMVAGVVSGMPLDQVAREAAQLMEGHAGGHNVLGQRTMGLVGDKAHDFNQKSYSERLKIMTAEAAKFQASKEIFGGSWEGLTSTLTDNLKSVKGALSGPLFDSLKRALADANGWFEKNADRVNTWAANLGMKIAYAFDRGREMMSAWWTAAQKFGAYLEGVFDRIWARAEPFLVKMESFGRNSLGDGTASKMVGAAPELFMASKAAGMAAGSFDTLVGVLEGTGLAMGLEAIGIAFGLVAAAGAALYGVYASLTDGTYAFQGVSKAALVGLWDNVKLFGSAAMQFWDAIQPLVELLGTTLLLVVTGAVATLRLLMESITGLAMVAHDAAVKLGIVKMSEEPTKYTHDDLAGVALPLHHAANAMVEASDHTKNGKRFDPEHVKGRGGTHIQKVEIVVTSNQDPSRIARMVHSELVNLRRNPRASRDVPNFSASK